VEGTIDALAIAAAVNTGLAAHLCPVTQSGRELSSYQLDAVLSLHPGPVVASFDGDAPGQDSNGRLARAVLARGREVVVVRFPTDMDPADWLAEKGPSGLATWVFHRTGLQPVAPASGDSPRQSNSALRRAFGSTSLSSAGMEVDF
jgi:hypothetical protein